MAYYENHDNYPGHYAADDSGTSKVVMAAVIGAAVGAVAGILLAPDKGSTTLSAWRSTAGRYGEELEGVFNKYLGKLEDMGVTGAGSSLRLRGDWNTLKGQLRAQYANLTDQDLTYAEGQEDQLVGNLQRALGKTKHEVVQLLNKLG